MPNHQPPPDHLPALDRLRAVVHLLRAPGGCPWDREQDHASLVPNLLEEAYETAAAIRSGDPGAMREELGDLLLQVVMHAEIASESGGFDLDQVAAGVAEKLVRRHPHVFADSTAEDSDAVLRQWDVIKRGEKGAAHHGFLDGVGTGLPALLRATKLQKKAAKAGFDWPDVAGPLAKVQEELDEALAAAGDPTAFAAELGDLLFAVINVARKAGLDAESLLADANQKFVGRFHQVERAMEQAGTPLGVATLAQMEAAWQAAKTRASGEARVEPAP
jgi:MazG family protein